MAKRKRRAFTKEFKAEAVRIIQASGRTVGAVARELDLTETALREWVRQAEIDAGRGQPGALTTDERAELAQLRREVRTLRMERDILKKATVGSTGRRNAGGEYSAGGQEAKGFARSHVELEGDGIEIRLSVRREGGAPREVLPQEPIGILVRPALPRTLGIAKVD
jgi:transposase